MKAEIRKVLFYSFLLIMGAFVVETDIIMGHHEAERMRSMIHWVEKPKEEESEDI